MECKIIHFYHVMVMMIMIINVDDGKDDNDDDNGEDGDDKSVNLTMKRRECKILASSRGRSVHQRAPPSL